MYATRIAGMANMAHRPAAVCNAMPIARHQCAASIRLSTGAKSSFSRGTLAMPLRRTPPASIVRASPAVRSQAGQLQYQVIIRHRQFAPRALPPHLGNDGDTCLTNLVTSCSGIRLSVCCCAAQSPFQTPAEPQGLQKLVGGLSETVAKLGAVLLIAVTASVAAVMGGGLLGAGLALVPTPQVFSPRLSLLSRARRRRARGARSAPPQRR